MPQTIFFVLAVILLFPDHPRVKKLLDRLETKYPRLIHFLERLGIGDDEPDEPVRHLSPPLCMETKAPAIQYEFRRMPAAESAERQEIR